MVDHHSFYHDLIELLPGDACALCVLVNRAIDRHLRAYVVEGVNDLDIRAKLRASRGYCHHHAHYFWRSVRHQLGAAMIYQDVVINLIRALEAADPTAGRLERLMSSLGAPRARAAADAAALQPQASCPACDAAADAERRFIGALLKYLREEPFVAIYRQSSGLCLPHFSRTLAQARFDDQIAVLVQTQLTIWRDLHAALGEYIRLQDYRFRDEPRGEEQQAPRRAIRIVAGEE